MASMVTYYKNDGSGETAIGIGTTASQVCYITSVGRNAVDWSGNGYYFVEWNTSADGSGTSYMPGDSNSTAAQLYAIWQADLSYLTKSSDLTSIADAIRAKGGTSAPLVYPAGFVSAIEAIPTGGGSSALYVLTEGASPNTSCQVDGHSTGDTWFVYRDPSIVDGATITFHTYGNFILSTVTGLDSGATYAFTTVNRGEYMFTMPGESVYCALLYDD